MADRPKGQWKIHNRFIVDGAKLTEARVAKGMSMAALAEQLGGCNKSQVSRWEQEKLVPNEDRIQKMAEILGTWAFVIGNPAHGIDSRRKEGFCRKNRRVDLEHSDSAA